MSLTFSYIGKFFATSQSVTNGLLIDFLSFIEIGKQELQNKLMCGKQGTSNSKSLPQQTAVR
jgi:hypothetical protein